jgi:hypothetical protein
MKKLNYLVSSLPLFFLSFTGCSVAPVLESPRIKPGLKMELGAIHLRDEVRWHLTDSVMRGGIFE